MLQYLHILIRVEEDGSLRALGAFTSREKQRAYQEDLRLEDREVRLDFFNGPFDDDIEVVYAGHRRWNMDQFQLAGYFKTEGEAWNQVTQEGYVSVLRVDTSLEEEKALEKEALERYAKLQKRWRLSSYEDLVAREGAEKARANLILRYYEDALESFRPKTQRDVRALYAFFIAILVLPVSIFYFLSNSPDYGENLPSVSWLPDYATDVSFYRSDQVNVFEFSASPEDFKKWAENKGMKVRSLLKAESVSRFHAYLPAPEELTNQTGAEGGEFSPEALRAWQDKISCALEEGLVAKGPDGEMALYDPVKKRAYYELLSGF
jgi:hypothetical protein